MSQLDGEWEGEDEDADEEDGNSGTGTQTGGGGAAGVEEELHTPKLSQRGLQLRAQMMKYGLSIYTHVFFFSPLFSLLPSPFFSLPLLSFSYLVLCFPFGTHYTFFFTFFHRYFGVRAAVIW
jgi:hypothetical protein